MKTKIFGIILIVISISYLISFINMCNDNKIYEQYQYTIVEVIGASALISGVILFIVGNNIATRKRIQYLKDNPPEISKANNDAYNDTPRSDNIKRVQKIIKITDTVISIGTEDGSIKDVNANDFNFVPHIGDEVEFFETDTKIIVSKAEHKNNFDVNFSNEQARVNKTKYCLLTFFLGGIGIHKFYANKAGIGLMYLVFCWTTIPTLIAFIEFIYALNMKADSNGNILV